MSPFPIPGGKRVQYRKENKNSVKEGCIKQTQKPTENTVLLNSKAKPGYS